MLTCRFLDADLSKVKIYSLESWLWWMVPWYMSEMFVKTFHWSGNAFAHLTIEPQIAAFLTVLVSTGYTAGIFSYNRKNDYFGGPTKFGKYQGARENHWKMSLDSQLSVNTESSTYRALYPWREVLVDSIQRVFFEHECSSSPWGHAARMNWWYLHLCSCWKQQ